MWLLLFLIGSGGLYQVSTAQNITEGSDREKRDFGGLGIFSVVKFPNDVCTGSGELQGTCYTSDECSTKNGVAAGECASGFGVCCVFSLSCGDVTSENTTFATVSTWTSATSNPCTYTYCKTSSEICKLRIDFESMTLASPNPGVLGAAAVTTPPTAPATVASDIAKIGGCDTDLLTITNPGGSAAPHICGVNTGQHMYIPASDSCNQINIAVNSGSQVTRSWKIKVTQHKCNSLNAPKEDCLQWHTGLTGNFASFSWDTSISTITDTSHVHLQNQYYDVCFRRERGYCQICFYPTIYADPATAAIRASFGVSSAAGAAIQSAKPSECIGTDSKADYIEITNLQLGGTAAAATINSLANRFCGYVWSMESFTINKNAPTTAPSPNLTGCTFSVPFKWGVRFDGAEFGAAAIGAFATNDNFNHATAYLGYGFTGFYMDYYQKACA